MSKISSSVKKVLEKEVKNLKSLLDLITKYDEEYKLNHYPVRAEISDRIENYDKIIAENS